MTTPNHFPQRSLTAFEGWRRIASGAPLDVIAEVKQVVDRGAQAAVLVFDDTSGRTVDFDLSGSLDDVLARLPESPAAERSAEAKQPPRGPGRPRLGVVAREVTLLPRHWEWLNSRPGGASAALRKLVDTVRKDSAPADRIRQAQESTDRFLAALAGDLPGYEEASRSLYARQCAKFEEMIEPWPADVRDHAGKLAAPAFRDARPSEI